MNSVLSTLTSKHIHYLFQASILPALVCHTETVNLYYSIHKHREDFLVLLNVTKGTRVLHTAHHMPIGQ